MFKTIKEIESDPANTADIFNRHYGDLAADYEQARQLRPFDSSPYFDVDDEDRDFALTNFGLPIPGATI